MQDTEKFNVDLENIHKKVCIHTKPTQVQEELARTHLIRQKPKPRYIKKAGYTLNGPVPEPNAEPPIAEAEVHEEHPAEAAPEAPLVEEHHVEKPVKEIPKNQVIDKTLYHCHKTKNTFHSVFPAYGLLGKEGAYHTESVDMSKNLDQAEPVDWSSHMKTDAVKRYTEEMLKAANMRGKKK